MRGRFDYFVIFAGMRTGSNFLERNLNSLPDLRCYGELFNPYFIAHENQESYLGITLAEREKDPIALVRKVRAETQGLAGFRLFHDHDNRIRDEALRNPRCAKIILMRNPVDSYVSYKLAMATDQWVLTDAKGQRDSGAIQFQRTELEAQLEDYAKYLKEIRRVLQVSGQTAFDLRYEDLQNIEVLQGLVQYLGSDHELKRFDRSLKKQNPEPLATKVTNLNELRETLSGLDPFGLDIVPSFEPTRGPSVPSYIASNSLPLVYMPLRSGPDSVIEAWLEAKGPTLREMSQKDLRQWRLKTPSATGFTVLRHPVARAWTAFVEKVLPSNINAFAEIRTGLATTYNVPLPKNWTHSDPDPSFDVAAAQNAFLRFSRFLKSNLSGQTSLRIDPAWASQLVGLQGFSSVAPPDLILREDEFRDVLPAYLAVRGINVSPPQEAIIPLNEMLVKIYTPKIEEAIRAAYPKDYAMLGFEDWSAGT